MRRSLLIACLLVLPASTAAHADSWMQPTPLLASSEDGRWYVVSNPSEGWSDAELLLVRRAEGRAPRTPPERADGASPDVPPIRPEPGDVVVARAKGHLPMQVRCLDGGKGFLLFDTYGALGSGTVFARYDGTGRRLWTRKLTDLFTAQQIEGFTHTVSSIWWSLGLWLDEARGKVVVVYELDGPHLLEADLATGAHAAGEAASVLKRFDRGSLEERILALDLAARLRPSGLLAVARSHFAREDLPPEVRLRLAVLMALEGDHAGDEIVVARVAKGQPAAQRAYAVQNLPVVLGDDALPHLRDVMRGAADEAWHPAMQAFRALGAKAVPTLVAMVGEAGASNDYRGGAASVLGDLGEVARPAVPALLEAARTAPGYAANAALNALVGILPEDELGPRLVTLLAVGSSDDGRIALHFQQHPRRTAVRALEAARARHRDDPDDTTRRWIDEALARCRRPR